jgi:chromate transporter
MVDPTSSYKQRLLEVVKVFLKFGFTAFGGPAAHIAMFHDEVVERRKWITQQQFLDLLGATNLIPGPNSTEMAIHLGFLRAGWAGLILAGTSFILPAMVIVICFAWMYTHYGSTPQVEWILYGIQPVVIAIILQALVSLGRVALKNVATVIASAIAIILYFLNIGPVIALVVASLVVPLANSAFRKKVLGGILWVPFLPLVGTLNITPIPFSLITLFLTFLKIGSVLYGSGYVLLAFLHADFVERLGWLTDQQLLDAITVGQFTPGPVFTTATFIGYLTGDLPGAIVATIGIFLPSFIFVAISNPLIPRLRNSPIASSFLDGLNAASLGLMAAVVLQLAQTAFTDRLSIVIAVLSVLFLFRYRMNPTWLILAGILIGLINGFLS